MSAARPAALICVSSCKASVPDSATPAFTPPLAVLTENSNALSTASLATSLPTSSANLSTTASLPNCFTNALTAKPAPILSSKPTTAPPPAAISSTFSGLAPSFKASSLI